MVIYLSLLLKLNFMSMCNIVFMSGHTLDTLKNDPQTGQRNQRPRFGLLLGLQGKVQMRHSVS